MDAETAVERALPLFGATAPGDWGALRAGVVRAGVAEPLAAEVAAFMPIAFGRELLNGMGIEFSPDYATYTPDGGARIAGPLAGHPVYAAAAARAARMVERQEAGDAFVSVAVWSAEFAAANQALNAGSEISDLVAGPPVVTLGHAPDPPGPASAPAEKKPWWKPWG